MDSLRGGQTLSGRPTRSGTPVSVPDVVISQPTPAAGTTAGNEAAGEGGHNWGSGGNTLGSARSAGIKKKGEKKEGEKKKKKREVEPPLLPALFFCATKPLELSPFYKMTYFALKNGFIIGEPSWEGLGPQTLPIRSAPYDILSKIFITCSKIDILSPMRIVSVCRRWRETILATPLAWTYICGAGIDEDRISPKKYSRLLQLSNPHMLFIKVDHLLSLCPFRYRLNVGHRRTCACPKIQMVFSEYSNRLRCLSIDLSWLEHTYPIIRFPNLEHLTLLTSMARRRLDMSRFPKLWHLRMPNGHTDITLPDFTNPHRPHLRHLEISVLPYDLWAPLVGMFINSLRTLVLSEQLVTGQTSGRKMEFPHLRALVIHGSDDLVSKQDALLELSVPRLIYWEYRSRRKAPLPGIIWDHRELAHIRTTQLLNLSDYPSLRILQIEDPNCKHLADIASQLQSDRKLCPELHRIEANIKETSLSVRNYTNDIYRQIYGRNKKAGSNVTLAVTQEWLTNSSIPSYECDDGAPCHS
ncbi:hypothetical protein M408DRAFT_31223 [Serendipita vermifera MAFF 305830]|uniref:F-box domain-containing protein n=1 Tax=Serendipita vermifera MAFF 305830 TaxID=933852 RepID=A0A0C2WP42_SERVB|nr:hypothetical protein M408DRAFT_31223 [Serendipita vermifera MAFF 305830]